MSIQTSRYPVGSLLASEIAQQSALWPGTLERIKASEFAGNIYHINVLVTGAGTSAYAASAITEAWPAAKAIPTTDLLLLSPAQIKVTAPWVTQGGLLISLARSGDSPESAAVVEKFQRHFPAVRHLAIVCNASGRLALLPGIDAVCLDPRTNDRSLAMTGSFTNLVLGGMALIDGARLADMLPGVCEQVNQSLLSANGILEQVAQSCNDRIVILASLMQALAKESALKIVELTAGRIMAMAETFLAFRHGPVGFLREDTPVVCFLSSDPQIRLYEEDMIEYLRERKLGRFLVIGDVHPSMSPRDWFIPGNAPGIPDGLRTPFEVPFAQLLAYHLAVKCGVDPDNPSLDGAITRVVRPFKIHAETA